MEHKSDLSVVVLDRNKRPPKPLIAHIGYKNIDGCHVFTSEQIKGLFIATPDAKKAMEQIVPTVKALLDLESNSDWEVELGEEFTLFAIHHCHGDRPVILDDTCVVIRKVA